MSETVTLVSKDKLIPCQFLDGPFRGLKHVRPAALEEGKLILSGTYQVQWNREDMRWEAVTT